MELSWSTFALEIVNFLVLVWILKRFLYKPVLDVIAKRRAGIEKAVADAQAVRADAQTLQDRYEGRLAEWEAERRGARDALAREIDEDRSKRMNELRDGLAQEREKAKAAEVRRLADARREIEEAALAQGARFAARLVEPLAGPEIEVRLFELVVTELSALPADRAAVVSGNAESRPASILVASAFPLSNEQRTRLGDALAKAVQLDVPVEYEQRPELLAGLRVTVGAWVLGMNLRDELQGFARIACDG